jgi:aerobic-type carbon monoxide dehydrogenase small subunit (CoxS/CutS family)
MIMSLVGTLNETKDETEVMQQMNANLCRCCGYDVIADAIKTATAVVKGGAK